MFSSSCSVYGAAGGGDDITEGAQDRPHGVREVEKPASEEGLAKLTNSASPRSTCATRPPCSRRSCTADLVLNDLVGWAPPPPAGRRDRPIGAPWRRAGRRRGHAAATTTVLSRRRSSTTAPSTSACRASCRRPRDRRDRPRRQLQGSTLTLPAGRQLQRLTGAVPGVDSTSCDGVPSRPSRPRWSVAAARELRDAYRAANLQLELAGPPATCAWPRSSACLVTGSWTPPALADRPPRSPTRAGSPEDPAGPALASGPTTIKVTRSPRRPSAPPRAIARAGSSASRAGPADPGGAASASPTRRRAGARAPRAERQGLEDVAAAPAAPSTAPSASAPTASTTSAAHPSRGRGRRRAVGRRWLWTAIRGRDPTRRPWRRRPAGRPLAPPPAVPDSRARPLDRLEPSCRRPARPLLALVASRPPRATAPRGAGWRLEPRPATESVPHVPPATPITGVSRPDSHQGHGSRAPRPARRVIVGRGRA